MVVHQPEGRRAGVDRPKKLIEAAQWHFGGIKDGSGQVIAGAARCEECRADAEDKKRANGSCDRNEKVEGPGGCVSPAPEIDPANEPIWRAFQRSVEHGGGINFRGMEGEPAGIRPEALESCARAARLPWTEDTQDRLGIVITYWKAHVDTMIKEQRDGEAKKAKAAKRGKAGRAASALIKSMKLKPELEN